MNPNVYASFALFSRLASHGVTHCVISPGSRSTPLAYVAHQLFDTTVVIDERDAGFVALGLSESTGRAPVVITTSGSAPTHLYPSVTEAFHSNFPMIVVTADRPHEVRGRGAPQTIDQVNMFNTGVRYFFDSLCPHDEMSVAYWQDCADELFEHAQGNGVHGPVHLNMGMREPLVPDGDENKTRDFIPFTQTVLPQETKSFGFLSTGFAPELILDQSVRQIIANAQTVVLTIGRNAHIDNNAMTFLSENMLWPILADATSNVRYCNTIVTTYDAIMRRGDAKNFIPDLVVQVGEPLTSKIWNEAIARAQVISVTQFDDDRDPYGNETHHIVTRDMTEFVRELGTIRTDPACDFFDYWKISDTQALQLIDHLLDESANTEPVLFAELGAMLNDAPVAGVLVGSSMPIRYAEWLWPRLSENLTIFSHRGTNGIDGMVSSAYGIAHGLDQSMLCVVGDVAFAHDIGFLTRCAQLTNEKKQCVVFFVIDNDGGAIFRHLDQARNDLLASVYSDLFQTQPKINIEELSHACGAQYIAGDSSACIEATKNILEKNIVGTHVVHVKVDHESGPKFMKQLREQLSTIS